MTMLKAGLDGGCFICNSKEGAHEHHVVPQAYGGTNGPRVVLCGTHHTLIHDIALQPLDQQLGLIIASPSVPISMRAIVLQITSTITKAKTVFREQRIAAQISAKLDRPTSAMVRELQAVHGFPNQGATIQACIQLMYNQTFPLKPHP